MASLIEQAGKSRSGLLGSFVETAQTRVEQRDYKSRKSVLDFDDVMNLQREIVYAYRNEILATEDTRRMVLDVIGDAVPTMAARFLEEREDHGEDIAALLHHLRSLLPIQASEEEIANLGGKDLFPLLVSKTREAYDQVAAKLPSEIVETEERRMMLHSVDRHWQEHIAAMDELRDGVYLRAQGQKDPLVEFKNEAFGLFARS